MSTESVSPMYPHGLHFFQFLLSLAQFKQPVHSAFISSECGYDFTQQPPNEKAQNRSTNAPCSDIESCDSNDKTLQSAPTNPGLTSECDGCAKSNHSGWTASLFLPLRQLCQEFFLHQEHLTMVHEQHNMHTNDNVTIPPSNSQDNNPNFDSNPSLLPQETIISQQSLYYLLFCSIYHHNHALLDILLSFTNFFDVNHFFTRQETVFGNGVVVDVAAENDTFENNDGNNNNNNNNDVADVAAAAAAAADDDNDDENDANRHNFIPIAGQSLTHPTLLHIAVTQADIHAVAILLRHGSNVNHYSPVSLSSLHIAVCLQHHTIIHMLLFQSSPTISVNPNPQNRFGVTPLFIAAFHNDFTALSSLLAHPNIDVNVRNTAGNTPLFMTAYHGHFACLNALLSHPSIATIDTPGQDGCTPVLVAAMHGHVACLEALLTTRAGQATINTPNSMEDLTPLLAAAHHGHFACVQILQQYCSSNTGKYQQSLVNTRVSTNVLKNHAQEHHTGSRRPDDSDNLDHSHSECCPDHLPSLHINHKNEHGYSALLLAVQEGHLDCIRALLFCPEIDISQSSNNYGNSPLSIAAHQGHIDCLQYLLQYQQYFNINQQNYQGETPLFIATAQNHVMCVKILLQQSQIDITIHNDSDISPLQLASMQGNVECIELFLQHYQNQLQLIEQKEYMNNQQQQSQQQSQSQQHYDINNNVYQGYTTVQTQSGIAGIDDSSFATVAAAAVAVAATSENMSRSTLPTNVSHLYDSAILRSASLHSLPTSSFCEHLGCCTFQPPSTTSATTTFDSSAALADDSSTTVSASQHHPSPSVLIDDVVIQKEENNNNNNNTHVVSHPLSVTTPQHLSIIFRNDVVASLHYAAEYGHFDCILQMLSQTHDNDIFNTVNDSGYTIIQSLLHYAGLFDPHPAATASTTAVAQPQGENHQHHHHQPHQEHHHHLTSSSSHRQQLEDTSNLISHVMCINSLMLQGLFIMLCRARSQP